MTGAPLEGARDRPDFVRGGVQRCWIDGDLIRLWTSPIGGIRPNGRRPPIPWLIDLSVLEQAMQSVYGRDFRLGDRIPVLQMAVDAMAAGDRAYAAELVDAVAFPEPEYFSTFRNACVQYLSWGPAHRRGNPRIDVDAWRSRKQLERKFDPNQPRVPRGHPDGGQWTDGGASQAENPGEELLSEQEQEEAELLAEQAQRMLADAGDRQALLVLAAWGPKPGTRSWWLAYYADVLERLRKAELYAGRNSPIWTAVAFAEAVNTLLPEFATFLDAPKDWDDLVADPLYRGFGSFEDFKDKYGSAGLFYDWHHLLEQTSGFSAEEINNTRNIVRVPRGRHWMITSYMTQHRDELGGISYREWLRDKPIEEHIRIGLQALRDTKVLKR